jgi:hypothetical protein
METGKPRDFPLYFIFSLVTVPSLVCEESSPVKENVQPVCQELVGEDRESPSSVCYFFIAFSAKIFMASGIFCGQ